jgi:predicted kinase
MATLFLICGLPGVGKTTLARQMEQTHPALRLCPDEWIAQILADASDRAELDRLRSPVEALQWEVARKVLALGCDVILEWGFWSREERRYYREQAEALGARVEVRFLEPSREELWARLSKRNANPPPGTFVVTEEQLDLWSSWYEPAAPEEREANEMDGQGTEQGEG